MLSCSPFLLCKLFCSVIVFELYCIPSESVRSCARVVISVLQVILWCCVCFSTILEFISGELTNVDLETACGKCGGCSLTTNTYYTAVAAALVTLHT